MASRHLMALTRGMIGREHFLVTPCYVGLLMRKETSSMQTYLGCCHATYAVQLAKEIHNTMVLSREAKCGAAFEPACVLRGQQNLTCHLAEVSRIKIISGL